MRSGGTRRKLKDGSRVMPVVDTEVLFALSPNDPKHPQALRILNSREDLGVADTSLMEFQIVLRGRGRSLMETRQALLALNRLLQEHHVEEVKTIDTATLSLQCEIELKHRLSYFDSLIAASAFHVDGKVVSDDRAFDRVLELERIPLK